MLEILVWTTMGANSGETEKEDEVRATITDKTQATLDDHVVNHGLSFRED